MNYFASSVIAVGLLSLAACGDAGEGDATTSGNGGSANGGSANGGGGTGGSTTATTGGAGNATTGGGGSGGSGDTWTTFGQAWFADYCTECHSAGDARDYTIYEGVVPDAVGIRCGVTPVALADCTGFPPPAQFPVGNGAKPSDPERQRLVDWIDAGLPE